MSKRWNQTRVASALGVQYPIIQGPLGGSSSQRLTAAVSNFGGLGSFGSHGLEPHAIKDVIAEIRSLTSKPFAMNLWVSMEDPGAAVSDATAFQRALSHLAPHIKAVEGTQPTFSPYNAIRFEDQARVLLDAKVPVFSFIFGIPPKEILDEAGKQGIITIGTATTPDEALALEQAGVNLVVASGFEAGGHRGSFLRSSEDSLTGTISLVPQTVDAVRIPVIAAGGIADARGIAAAFALGAEGVQMGTHPSTTCRAAMRTCRYSFGQRITPIVRTKAIARTTAFPSAKRDRNMPSGLTKTHMRRSRTLRSTWRFIPRGSIQSK